MAQFGWAYIDCDDFENSGSEGPPNSLQFVTESGGATTGSALLTYYTASTYSYLPSTMVLSGTLLITGGISASYYHIENISIIDATGSTFFGDDQTDIHARTGSLEMYNDSSLIFKIDALDTGAVSGSGALQMVGATTLGSTLNVSGNVGISTTPSAPLHIYKAATTTVETVEMMRLQVADEGVDMEIGSGPGIDFYVGETGGSNYGGTVAVVREEAADADSSAAMAFHTAEDDQTPAAAREKMRITSTGKVGIGSTAPSHVLTVSGAISGSAAASFGAGLAATGDISGSSTLQVVGATTLGSTLNVTGAVSGGVGFTGASWTSDGDISGSSTLQVVGATILGSTLNVSGASTFAGNVLPVSDNTKDLGSAAKRWANVYTADLHLRNERGDWTIVEEEEYLCVVNNKTGKKYKMNLIPLDDEE